MKGFPLTICLERDAAREGRKPGFFNPFSKVIEEMLKASQLLLWTCLHIVRAGLLVPLVNGVGKDPSFRAYWVLIAAQRPLGAGAASCSASS